VSTAGPLHYALEWLEHLKPLWDFLTAVGSIGLAVVTAWLATRKPKMHLSVSTAMADDGDRVKITAINDGEAPAVFLKFSWRASGFKSGRIDLTRGDIWVNGTQPAAGGTARLVTGDIVTALYYKHVLAGVASEVLPEDLDGLERTIGDSRFVCVTTTGESFETPPPQTVQKLLADRTRLLRQSI
jgi:hypothetical protein